MGFFSRKKVVQISSSYMALVDGSPDLVNQSVFHSVLDNRDIVSNLMDDINGCLGNKLGEYHKFALDGKYTNGLPEGDFGYQAIEHSVMYPIIEKYYPAPAGETISIVSAVMGEPVDYSLAQETLDNDSRYDFSDNSFLMGLEPFTFRATVVGTEIRDTNTLRIFGQVLTGSEPDKIYELDIPPYTKYYPNELYVKTEFTYSGTPDRPRFYNYIMSSGTEPSIKPPTTDKTLYLPIVPLRISNVDYTAEDKRDTPLYKTSRDIMNIFGVDILNVAEGINASPDIGEIDHAYFLMGVNPLEDNDGANKYMFEFFKQMYGLSQFRKEHWDQWLSDAHPSDDPPYNDLHIKDDSFNARLAWAYVDQEIKKGKLGPIGTVTKKVVNKQGRYIKQLWRWGYKQGSGESRPEWHESISIDVDNPENLLTLRKQISETEYEELTVFHLMYANMVYGQSNYHTSYFSLGDQDNQQFVLIPVNTDLAYNLDAIERNELVHVAMHIVINAIKVTKLKWYQSNFFRFVIQVIGIAISVIALGSDGGFFAGLATAMGAGIAAVGTFVLNAIFNSIIIAVGFKFAVEILGTEFAMILAVVVAIYAMANIDVLLNLPSADSILQMGSTWLEAIGEVMMEDLQSIADAMAVEQEYQADKWEELQAAQETLTQRDEFDVMGVFTEIGMLPNESPDSFLSRLTGSTIYNTMTLDAIANYADTNLQLPTTGQTL